MNTHPGNKYIFCVSPGRSGTHYLHRIFSGLHGVCAVHEPEHQYPEYARLKPRLWDLKHTSFQDNAAERRTVKLAQIRDLMEKTHARIYTETNPLFSTLWHDVILNALHDQDVTVIILRRSAPAVLKSLLDLGWFQTKDGNRWMVTAYSVNSLVQHVKREPEADATDLIIGYLLNVEAYARRIKKLCEARGHSVIELSSSALFRNMDSVHQMLGQCGLIPENAQMETPGSAGQNKQTIREKALNTPIQNCEQRISDYLAACAAAHMEVPELCME